MLEPVFTTAAARPRAPYSQGIRAGNTLYLSGQIGIAPGSDLLANGLEEQARQALTNVKAVLEAAGANLSSLASVTVYLTDQEQFAVFNPIYAEFLDLAVMPARTTVIVKELPLGALVEVTAIAVVP